MHSRSRPLRALADQQVQPASHSCSRRLQTASGKPFSDRGPPEHRRRTMSSAADPVMRDTSVKPPLRGEPPLRRRTPGPAGRAKGFGRVFWMMARIPDGGSSHRSRAISSRREPPLYCVARTVSKVSCDAWTAFPTASAARHPSIRVQLIPGPARRRVLMRVRLRWALLPAFLFRRSRINSGGSRC